MYACFHVTPVDMDFCSTSVRNIEHTLTDALIPLSQFFKKWKLIPSPNKTEVSCFHLTNKLAKREMQGLFANQPLKHNHFQKYLGVTLDRALCFKKHLTKVTEKLTTRNNIIKKLCGTTWGATATTLRTSALALT